MTSTTARTIVFLLLIGCFSSPTDPSQRSYPIISHPAPIVAPDSVLVRYTSDAYRLAVRHMQATGMADVEVPEELHRSILNALGHIHRASDLPARDSVIEIFNIHTFPNPTLNEVTLIGLDTSCTWASRLAAAIVPTGHPVVDSLMHEYELSVRQVFGFGASRFVLLRTSKSLHIAELARRFHGIECLTGAEPNGIIGDGSDILAEAETDAWKITFSLGWGDCPAGCISRYFWVFRVRSDGRVEYLGSGGTPIPGEGPRD